MSTLKTKHMARRSSDATILRAACTASGRSQRAFAERVLGMSLSGFTGWLGGAPCPAAIVRLCWAIAERPALADDIEAEFAP